jgi:hypothetical protein
MVERWTRRNFEGSCFPSISVHSFAKQVALAAHLELYVIVLGLHVIDVFSLQKEHSPTRFDKQARNILWPGSRRSQEQDASAKSVRKGKREKRGARQVGDLPRTILPSAFCLLLLPPAPPPASYVCRIQRTTSGIVAFLPYINMPMR